MKKERRLGIERRVYSYTAHIPERRSGMDRRSGQDRRPVTHRKGREAGKEID